MERAATVPESPLDRDPLTDEKAAIPRAASNRGLTLDLGVGNLPRSRGEP